MNWVSASFISLLSFGLWGFFTKLAVNFIDAKSAFIYQSLGGVIVSVILIVFFNFRPQFEIKGFSFALLIGITYSIGCLFYFVAASKGKITTVITLTALYPVVTIIMAHFMLNESISLRQGLGIGVALFAIYLMSS